MLKNRAVICFFLGHNNCHVLLQMNLCEQETATAVQDLEVRQMELEVQRRRLEQVTHILYSAFTPLLQPSLLVPSLPLFLCN